MPNFSRRFIYALSNKVRQKDTEDSPEGKLTVDFSRTKKTPFDIKSETSYNAYLSNGSLELGLKKSNCIAWVDMPDQDYRDHVIEAKFRLDSLGGYASAGIIFHLDGQDSYYLALASSKGYFRLDLVKDSAPKALIAWSEIPDFDGTNVNLTIITYGTYLIFVVNGKWLGEVNDDSVVRGKVGFALASYEAASYEAASYEAASYEAASGETEETKDEEDSGVLNPNLKKHGAKIPDAIKYTCKAWLDYISIDTRTKIIEETFKKWNDDSNINADGRLRLAETFAVMGEATKALAQLNRAWKRRDEAIRSVSASYTEVRTKKELLLAARMSLLLGQYTEAENFIDALLEQWPDSEEAKLAYPEKLKAMGELNKFAELKEFVLKNPDKFGKDLDYHTLLARCHWELKEYEDSAAMWEKAHEINGENGVYATNAASALELAGKSEEALARFLDAGRIFLKQDNMPELAALIPKLLALGEKNWEVHALAGKWAFSIEDYDKSAEEFSAANKLRCAIKPRPKGDPALFYLWGIVSGMKGRKKASTRQLERAVKLAPDYGLFRFKLAEVKLKNGVKDPKLANELKLALEQIGDDPGGKMAAHAGNLLKSAGYAKRAQYFFDKANEK